MKKSDFYFELPPEQIAQTPAEPRDHSKLMVIDRKTGEISHLKFYDLADLLNPGDCLILNDTKVLPARLYGEKEGTGAFVEMLLLENKGNDIWEAVMRPGRKLPPKTKVRFGEGLLNAEVLEIIDDGKRLVKLSYRGEFYSLLDKIGQMPLPHYITAELKDNERYQTVYAKEQGSAAAPTAGLHFTPQLLDKIKSKGVSVEYVTLHVGLGTFRPVKTEDITKHIMHTEHYVLPQHTSDCINRTRQNGGRVFAVGTTSCRTLESVAKKYGKIVTDSAKTDIFIYPPYEFKVLDGLITNFHLPESTLIMLVSAFAGTESTKNAYQTAIKKGYRFYSFGDSMMIMDTGDERKKTK